MHRTTWLQHVGEAYERRFGAHTFNYGKQGRHLQPLFVLPIEDILPRLERYWTETRPGQINHAKFAETWQSYDPAPTPDDGYDPITKRPTAYGKSLGFT